jgi:hypothetical protein
MGVRVSRARRTIDTRKVYAFERWLDAPREPMAALRRLAARIWRDYGGSRKLPRIVAGRGTRYNGRCYSYCLGNGLIVLARHHRERITVIHELTHALGPRTHGTRFQNLYAELLMGYL